LAVDLAATSISPVEESKNWALRFPLVVRSNPAVDRLWPW